MIRVPRGLGGSIARRLAVAGLIGLCLVGCERSAQSLAAAGDRAEVSDNEEVQGRGEGKDEWWDALPRAAWSEFRQVVLSQDWFEVYEIVPGVLAIYEPGQFEEVISYLIIGSERALLFDSGLGIGDMRELVRELTDQEVVLLNSHTHYDHVGGNHAFDTIYGTSLEYTRRSSAGRRAGGRARALAGGLQTLKRKLITSPSRTTYSLPSSRNVPRSRQAAHAPAARRSS